ncbi:MULTISPECIES: DUF2922 domain-containing protein [Dehalobacter]|jgi:hypothetical protein|uniref:DUF2922 family protein n=2 Tax=Dehalobacter restrictus TaxID=55583 RepID=A0A857DKY4_9FIRM|nr:MULTISPECIES: DUF2922 domain-containing protein [Dehalobacter]AHF10972.1 hypothetical protein DEHRE_13600 [Dehalobacter restrictus DSM 9455]MDJ0307080.1 DUF2922 domain-containing protein [Dehalobacter sp.]OCZ49618.1 hypothetical protein A7D23_01950 [Dehalobacter sp. TeCB1]QHA01617.1 DUF2922 family protein [Dehalobacter restrictus]
MAITTSKVARLSFATAGGKTFTITIPDPREDLNQTEALAVMNTIVESNIFMTSSGALTGVRDIKVIDTTTDDLYDPPQA